MKIFLDFCWTFADTYTVMNNLTQNIGSMMKLVPQREVSFKGSRVTSISLPALWVRKNLKKGDTIGLFVDADTNSLVIKKVEKEVN